MTYSDKIKELRESSRLLMDEYLILAREINVYLRAGTPVEQDMIRLQNLKQQQLVHSMSEWKKVVATVTSNKGKFTDPYNE